MSIKRWWQKAKIFLKRLPIIRRFFRKQYIFPNLRKVPESMIAHQLVSVQPMNAPVGIIFYLNMDQMDLFTQNVAWWFEKKPVLYGVGQNAEAEFRIAAHPQFAEYNVLGAESIKFWLGEFFRSGTHELASMLLKNPGLPLDLWWEWCWLNPDAALQNPSLVLWLLENPNFFQMLHPLSLYALLTSKHFPKQQLEILFFGDISALKTTRNETDILQRCVECPAMPTEWLLEVRENSFDYPRYGGVFYMDELRARGYKPVGDHWEIPGYITRGMEGYVQQKIRR